MLNELLQLFIIFAKVGVMTFGGGMAMLPILQREVVENKKWATDEELTDYFAISPFREVRTSAALAAAFWILLSGAFSLLSDRLMDLTLYGGLSAMVLTMLWLFYCHYILLIGAGLCAWWQTKKEAAIS